MSFLDASIVERPWSGFIRLNAIPNDALDIERGKLVGGTYMTASCAAKEVACTYLGPTTEEDAYLGYVPGQRWTVSIKPQPWVRMLEPIDYQENIRLHSIAQWSNSRTERRRHTAKYKAAMQMPHVAQLFHDIEGALALSYSVMYDELFYNYEQYADYSFEMFRRWAHEHGESASGQKDAYGRSLTWDRVLAMPDMAQAAYKDVRDAVKALVRGYEENKPRILSHDYAWTPYRTFRALRNRPETKFHAGAVGGELLSRNATYVTRRYRDRAAGGIKVLSWLFAFIPPEHMHDYVGNAVRKAIDAAGLMRYPYSGPIFDGLKSYVEVLEHDPDNKAYVDMSNCEKYAGTQGFSIGRIAFRGSGEDTLRESLSEDSGHAFTTEDNIDLNLNCIGPVLDDLGVQPKKVVVHGDNIALLGVDPDVAQLIEETMQEVYTAESVWLGHGSNRVIGLKYTKDSKEHAIALPPDMRVRPSAWHPSPDKMQELTSALLCRDVVSRHLGGPTYLDVLKQLEQRLKPQEVEIVAGRWNGLQDGIEKLSYMEDFENTISPLFGDARQKVLDNVKKLVE